MNNLDNMSISRGPDDQIFKHENSAGIFVSPSHSRVGKYGFCCALFSHLINPQSVTSYTSQNAVGCQVYIEWSPNVTDTMGIRTF